MFKNLKNINYPVVAADLATAALMSIWALIIGPLGILRGPLNFDRFTMYMWVFIPQGLLTDSVRIFIDWRVGSFDSAISKLESMVASTEDYYGLKKSSKARQRVLQDLYTLLTRAYLHSGHIDDAMHVVIRAKKMLGVDRLSGLAELDSKTAHLVRAGLAAGRLLEGDGLATMFVKSTQTDDSYSSRQGASASDDDYELLEDEMDEDEGEITNVIQFPRSPNLPPEGLDT